MAGRTLRIAYSSLVFSAALTAACSSDDHTRQVSKTADVTIPGNSSTDEALFWVTGDNMMRGICQSGVTPNRANCKSNIVSLPMATARANAVKIAKAELDKLTAEQTAEVKRLKDTNPSVTGLAQEISVLSSKVSQLNQQLASIAASVKADADEKTKVEGDLTWLDGQLAVINKSLSTDPQNRDLQRLKEQYLQERDAAAQRFAFLTSDLETLAAQQATAKVDLDQTSAELAARQAEYKALYDNLVVRSTALDSLTARIAGNRAATAKIDGVSGMIQKGDLTYRGSLLSTEERAALTLISSGFGGTNVLRDGHYIWQSGYQYTAFNLVQTYNGGQLAQLTINWSGGGTDVLTCRDNSACSKGAYLFRVIDQTHVNITYNGSYTAVFAFSSENR